MNYSIYISNGQIVRIVSTNNIQQQLSAGESFINGVYQDDKYYIENLSQLKSQKIQMILCILIMI